MPYCVISYDFVMGRRIYLHCIHDELEKADYIYETLKIRFHDGYKRSLELICVPIDYFSESGFEFFTSDSELNGVEIIKSIVASGHND